MDGEKVDQWGTGDLNHCFPESNQLPCALSRIVTKVTAVEELRDRRFSLPCPRLSLHVTLNSLKGFKSSCVLTGKTAGKSVKCCHRRDLQHSVVFRFTKRIV